MAQHNYVGQVGEKLAKEYLEKEGYKILEQNYKTKFAEIDLVAQKPSGFLREPTLVFVEVRTKVGEQWGSPEETINKQKLWKVLQNARSYAGFKQWPGPQRIDAICIVLSAQGGSASGGKLPFKVTRLTHHQNIVS